MKLNRCFSQTLTPTVSVFLFIAFISHQLQATAWSPLTSTATDTINQKDLTKPTIISSAPMVHNGEQETTDLAAAPINQNSTNAKEKNSSSSSSSQADGRSMEASPTTKTALKHSTSARGGRMLDLDHLAGDIGKEEKLAKERSLSGDRQSRILTDDQLIPQTILPKARSLGGQKKSKSKKGTSPQMSIKGFIPIVSLEGATKVGKQASSLDEVMSGGSSSNEAEEDQQPQQEDDEQEEQQQQQLREQLAANFGAQTSMGHASYAPNQSPHTQTVDDYNQQQQQQQLYPQHQMAASSDNQLSLADQSTSGRAKRKLLGAALSGLTSSPNRFVSNLISPSVPHLSSIQLNQLQSPGFAGAGSISSPFAISAPMNLPPGGATSPFSSSNLELLAEPGCMCVPFFQCKNGFLSEAQMSKSQLQQLTSSLSQANSHQIPRSLNNNNNNEQQQQQQQLVNEMIYEQLRKSIESSNLEQQLQLQQQQQQQQLEQQQSATGFNQLDERSKSGGQGLAAAAANSTSGANQPVEASDLQGRSLLSNPAASLLSRRQSSVMSGKCGIMRTCCRIPPHLISSPVAPSTFHSQQQQQLAQYPQQQHNNPMRQGMQAGRLVSSQSPAATTTYNHLQRPRTQANHQQQPQYQFLQPATAAMDHAAAYQQQQPAASQSASALMALTSGPSAAHQFMSGKCGTRQTLGIAGRVQNVQPAPGSESQAEFGEFPAHAAILKRLSPGDSLFVCSATLISSQWLATAAHCVARKYRPEELKVRLGEWDVNRDDEFYPHMETNIREIVVHPDYQSSSLINDIALLRMEQPVAAAGGDMPHITPACLAVPEEQFAGQRCWLAGWGKDAFGQAGTFQSVLKKVDLPVMGRSECESALRFQTKLGRFFRLHQSAICAGGERGKDACEGDGGAGLYCTDPASGLIKVAGLVSWGVGCGQRGVPGVYTNLSQFYRWISSVVSASGTEPATYDNPQLSPLYDRSSVGINEQTFKSLISERSNHQQANNNSTTVTMNSQSEYNQHVNNHNVTLTTQAPPTGDASVANQEPESVPKVGMNEEQLESRAG